MKYIIVTIFFLVVTVGIIALQIFLSKRRNKWLGLILPFVCVVFSIIVLLGMANFSSSTTTEQTFSESGQIVETITYSEVDKNGFPSMMSMSVSVLLLCNIPAVIFLTIHAACREKMKRKKELEKMNMYDLE